MGIQRSLKAEKERYGSSRERFFTRLHYASTRLTTDERRGLPYHTVSSLFLATRATVVTRAVLEICTTPSLINPRRRIAEKPKDSNLGLLRKNRLSLEPTLKFVACVFVTEEPELWGESKPILDEDLVG